MGDGHKKALQAQSNVRHLVTHRERTLNSIMAVVDESDDDELSPEALEQIESYLWDDDAADNDFARQHLLQIARGSLSMRILLGIYHRAGPDRPGGVRAREILLTASS